MFPLVNNSRWVANRKSRAEIDRKLIVGYCETLSVNLSTFCTLIKLKNGSCEMVMLQ